MKRKKNPKPEKQKEPSQDGFSPSERDIFRYWNWSKMVAADPLRLHRALLDYPDANLELDGKLLRTETPEMPKAYGRLVGAVRHVFGIPEFSESDDGKISGLLDAQCMGLLVAFGAYQEQIADDTRPFDIAADYGGNVLGRPATYREYCGLYLNRGRAMHRRAYSVMLALGASFGKPTKEMFEAVTDSAEEAIYASELAAAARERAEANNRLSRNGMR